MKKRTSLKVKRRKRIHWGIRKKVSGTPDRPRLTVFKSNHGIYAQLIDDVNGRTLASAGFRDKGFEAPSNKTEQAKAVGTALAQKAKDNNIDNVVFDRSGYKYHGIIKALADAAREGGLKF